jgi:hypothetical protein
MQHRAHPHRARTDDNQAINTFIDNSLGSGHPFGPTIPYLLLPNYPTDNPPLHLGGEFNIFGPPSVRHRPAAPAPTEGAYWFAPDPIFRKENEKTDRKTGRDFLSFPRSDPSHHPCLNAG